MPQAARRQPRNRGLRDITRCRRRKRGSPERGHGEHPAGRHPLPGREPEIRRGARPLRQMRFKAPPAAGGYISIPPPLRGAKAPDRYQLVPCTANHSDTRSGAAPPGEMARAVPERPGLLRTQPGSAGKHPLLQASRGGRRRSRPRPKLAPCLSPYRQRPEASRATSRSRPSAARFGVMSNWAERLLYGSTPELLLSSCYVNLMRGFSLAWWRKVRLPGDSPLGPTLYLWSAAGARLSGVLRCVPEEPRRGRRHRPLRPRSGEPSRRAGYGPPLIFPTPDGARALL